MEPPRSSVRSASGMLLNVVVQLNEAVVEPFNGVQIQGYVAMTARYQRNAIANKHWSHADDELVDRLLVEEGGDELAPTHQPAILAGLLPKTPHERTDFAAHELHTRRRVGWASAAGEDDASIPRVELRPQSQARLVGFPADHHRV